MFNIGSNQILLLSCLVLLIGAGTYLTYFRQQNTLQSLEQEIEAAEAEREKIQTLRVSLSDANAQLKKTRQRWDSRYKIVPETVSSPSMVGYLTQLTQTGFRSFDVTSEGTSQYDDYSVRTLSAEGTAFFPSLYQFVWTVENNRPFYRVRNLQLDYQEERTQDEETGRTSMDVLVSFQMDVEAIYGAVADIGEESGPSDGREVEGLPVARTSPRPPLPSRVLPNPALEINPFYPLIFDEIPPNEYGRLNVESAELVSIIDGEAVFSTGDGIERVGEGDRVYLGRILEVNSSEGRVVARLNKGGVVETVELTLGTEPASQQSAGGDGGQQER